MLHNMIHTLRERSGMSQAQLGKALNISASTVGMYEQGRREPNINVLLGMSKIFGVSLDYLITGSEFTQAEATIKEKRNNCPCSICYWKNYK